LARSGLRFLAPAEKLSGQNVDGGEKVSAIEADFVSLPEPEPSQSLMPETLSATETRRAVHVMPRAADLDGPVSNRFDEVWNRWPRKEQRDRALRDWLSFVSLANEAEVLSCVDRYLGSDEVRRGVVKQLFNFLEQQHRDGWAGDWPPARAEGAPAVSSRQAGIDADWMEVVNGKR
jgi:hypothetical protein